jgi:hypothetical protein
MRCSVRQNVGVSDSKDAVSTAVMGETLMIIDVKNWNRRLQDAIYKAFPGKQLKIDDNVPSLRQLIKKSLVRRGIALNDAVLEKERNEIIPVLNASDLGEDLRLYMRTFGGPPKAIKGKPSKEEKKEPSKRKDSKEEYQRPQNGGTPNLPKRYLHGQRNTLIFMMPGNVCLVRTVQINRAPYAVLERTRAGLEAARCTGRVGGRKRRMTDGKVQAARSYWAAGCRHTR